MIIHGDSLEVLRTLEENSVDAVITDPPYGLSFMGKKWDYDVPCIDLWKEVLRVLKPGGHCLSFGGTRTYHRLASAIEDAGFEIRDQIQWLYGSGFPKSHNLGDGRGTALKPANEPIVLARKPLSEKTVAKNVEQWGTGGLNIDGCRVAGEPWKALSATGLAETKFFTEGKTTVIDKEPHAEGRWPANLLLDEEAAQLLDEQSGVLKPAGNKDQASRFKKTSGGSFSADYANQVSLPTQEGGASRFFYVAKASKRERNAGLEGMPTQVLATTTGQTRPNKPARLGADPHAVQEPVANHHPTVKPIKLMEYLCKLITPPVGTILDPFCGSGSTGVAAKRLGFKFMGIEREADYVEIAKRRIGHATEPEEETKDLDQVEMNLG